MRLKAFIQAPTEQRQQYVAELLQKIKEVYEQEVAWRAAGNEPNKEHFLRFALLSMEVIQLIEVAEEQKDTGIVTLLNEQMTKAGSPLLESAEMWENTNMTPSGEVIGQVSVLLTAVKLSIALNTTPAKILSSLHMFPVCFDSIIGALAEEALDDYSTIEVTPELIELARSVVSGPIPGFTVTIAQNAVPATETGTYTF